MNVSDGAVKAEKDVRAARWGFYFEQNCRDIVVVGGDAYDEHRKKHPDNYSWKVHFGPWRAGYMDVTINNFVMRYGMYDIEEESKKNRKYFDKNSNYIRGIYESNSVEF